MWSRVPPVAAVLARQTCRAIKKNSQLRKVVEENNGRTRGARRFSRGNNGRRSLRAPIRFLDIATDLRGRSRASVASRSRVRRRARAPPTIVHPIGTLLPPLARRTESAQPGTSYLTKFYGTIKPDGFSFFAPAETERLDPITGKR